MVTCPACGQQVPEGKHCVRCGSGLASGAGKRGFSAAPHEGLAVPRLVSTIYPHLPRSSMATFRIALVVGLAAVVGLGVAGLFPIALVAAAALMPLVTVIYLYDVDLYEDEPVHVVALTMAWGAAAGIAVDVLARVLSPSDAGLLFASTGSRVAVRGILIPVLSSLLMLAGPLALLPYRKFNDVLDGATFGAASAVSFAGGLAITQALPLLGTGLRPTGAVVPWIYRLLELAVALPILFAAAIGGAAGAFWLRYRSPVRDRRALGWIGHPLMSTVAATTIIVLSALLQISFSTLTSLLLLVLLDLLSLLWLRRVIHIGLVQEASEIKLGENIACPNCGATTPRHSFCANCGISLRALPKGRPRE